MEIKVSPARLKSGVCVGPLAAAIIFHYWKVLPNRVKPKLAHFAACDESQSIYRQRIAKVKDVPLAAWCARLLYHVRVLGIKPQLERDNFQSLLAFLTEQNCYANPRAVAFLESLEPQEIDIFVEGDEGVAAYNTLSLKKPIEPPSPEDPEITTL